MNAESVKWFQFENSIVLNIEGKSYMISKSDKRYEEVIEAIKSGEERRLKAIVAQDNIIQMKKLLNF